MARKAVALKDAVDASGAEAKNIEFKFHLCCGRGWGGQLKQISVNAGGEND